MAPSSAAAGSAAARKHHSFDSFNHEKLAFWRLKVNHADRSTKTCCKGAEDPLTPATPQQLSFPPVVNSHQVKTEVRLIIQPSFQPSSQHRRRTQLIGRA